MKPFVVCLAIFCLIGCNQEPATTEPTAPAPAAAKPAIDEHFEKLFETTIVVKMHLFGTKEAEPKEADYAYVGKLIADADLKFLDKDLQPNEIGKVYACYHAENYNLYVLRVPGKYASSDLVLAKWDDAASKLVKIMDLASIQCDEGMCHQQDAWLTDLDDDRVLELVVRSQTNDNGKISEEVFTVMNQPTPGSFAKAPEQLASLAPPTSYVLNMFK